MLTARELRGQVRAWRRGRAEARLSEVLQDVYVGLFAAVMLGAILVNVLIGLGDLAGQGCTTGACRGARTVVPLVVALGSLGVLLSFARLLGPVFVSPAVGSWLVSTPADRRGLLRPRAVLGVLAASVAAAGLTAAAATLSGWPLGAGILLVVSVVLVGVGVLGASVRAQVATWRGPARRVSLLPGLLAWALLLAVATGLTSGAAVGTSRPWWWAVPVAAAVVTLGGVVLGSRALGLLRRSDVARAGRVLPAISGALASLDLSLVWDVVTDHQWRDRAAVRSRRGRWTGPAAVVWADLARLRRSPARLVRLAAAATVPLAAHAAGVGEVLVLLVALTGFVAGLPLLSSLRIIERSPGLARMLPFPTPVARTAASVVPLVALALFGLALSPALPAVPGRPLLGAVTGVCAAAAGVRWMTGRPPDYEKPLVSTPAGGVPTNLYGSIARGFDVLLLTTAPMLLSYSTKGAIWSLAFCVAVLGYLLGRE